MLVQILWSGHLDILSNRSTAVKRILVIPRRCKLMYQADTASTTIILEGVDRVKSDQRCRTCLNIVSWNVLAFGSTWDMGLVTWTCGVCPLTRAPKLQFKLIFHWNFCTVDFQFIFENFHTNVDIPVPLDAMAHAWITFFSFHWLNTLTNPFCSLLILNINII